MKHISPYFINGTRMGNNMFVLAAAYAYSLRQGIECRVPWHDSESTQTLHRYLGNILPGTLGGKNETIVYQEPSFCYQPLPEGLNGGGIRGYFQSSRYFDAYREEIRNLFSRFIAPTEEGTLGLHIRLGDYQKYSDFFYVSNSRYLKNVSKQLSPDIRKLVIFTDEPTEALKKVKYLKLPEHVEIEIDDSSPCDAIRRMTAMSEFIMSASSFSWWGAYLGSARKVYAPKDWFIVDTNYNDIYVPNWIRVPNLNCWNHCQRNRIVRKLFSLWRKVLMKIG